MRLSKKAFKRKHLALIIKVPLSFTKLLFVTMSITLSKKSSKTFCKKISDPSFIYPKRAFTLKKGFFIGKHSCKAVYEPLPF